MGSIERAIERSQEQRSLEIHLQQLWDKGVHAGDRVVEKFGSPEVWQLKIGDITFFLNPIIKEWMFLDPIHDTWIKTGISINKAIIYTLGKKIYLKNLRILENENQPFDLSITQQQTKYCNNCHHKQPPGAVYCYKCGSLLDKGRENGNPN